MSRLSAAQCQPLSSAEADELLDRLPATPVVPPVPGQADPPFNTLSPGQFERLYLWSEEREGCQRAERQAEHLFQTLLHRAFRGEL